VNAFYLDASAVAKRYAPEVGSTLLDHLFAHVQADRLHVFAAGIAEVVSVLVRKRNAGRISAAVFGQALLDLGAEIIRRAVRKPAADIGLVTAALPLIVSHSINGTDALVLCSALREAGTRRTGGDDLVLVASDQRLLRAARAEGLLTFDPETQSQSELDALL